MKAIRLQTEYLTEPLGLGIDHPRFSWNCDGGIRQTAYQIVAKRKNETVWDTGKVPSSAMSHISYSGQPLCSRDRIEWSVTLWDENNHAGDTVSSWFELGLLHESDWTAKWISGAYKPSKKERYPVDCFRRCFSVSGQVKTARLYAAARGVYDVTVNGTRVEEFILAPGMTDYRKRIQYQVYDITALLKNSNAIELQLADGWYRGSVAAYGVTNVYGTQTSVMAQIELTMRDGTVQTIGTDRSWEWSNDGPIRFADLKDGEVYDATMEASYSGKAREVASPKGVVLCASDNVPVLEHETFTPTLLNVVDGTRVLDFGQNIAGYLEFTIHGKKHQTLRLICGEVLDDTGHVDLSGIQETRPAKGWSQLSMIKKLMTGKVSGAVDVTPRQEICFTCSGGQDHYKTSFAVFGFRYVQLEGEVDINLDQIRAIAVYSAMEQTGEFSCSDALVNRLVSNTRWSMKGNFLDVPTDCPTRERLGWTGDAQIFFDTGAYLMNTAPFFRKWLRDMQDAQYANGLLPAVLPYSGVEMMYKATGVSVGWADAIYLVPWRYYLRFGDIQMLHDSWPMISRYADYLMNHLGMSDKKAASTNPHNAYTYEKGVHLGEWLEPEEFRDKVYGAQAKHPEECTAYLYYSMTTIAQIASLIGKPSDIYKKYADGAKAAYDALFVQTGTLDTDRQAKLVRPLALGLIDRDDRIAAQQRLKLAVEHYNYRVSTGFLSTPFILPVLTEAGEIENAYRMLQNTEKPGWLAEVKAGATTVWENWDGEASQNHYSPGAVCQWLFDTVCGIRIAAVQHFVICPVPGGTLTHAEGRYLSPYGWVSSAWKYTDDHIVFDIVIPSNTTADIQLPDGTRRLVAAGRHTITITR